MHTVQQAQRNNARIYREYARRAPWNSKTRREWIRMAESAESLAAMYERGELRQGSHKLTA